MSKIRSSDTKAEIALRKALWSQGFNYRINSKRLQGKPDISIAKYKLVIFVDGEFWHGYNWEEKKRRIKRNRSYWIPEIEKNIKRDRLNDSYYSNRGWKVFRFWEHEIKADLEGCLDKILCYLREHGSEFTILRRTHN